jgi:hypothetical protein
MARNNEYLRRTNAVLADGLTTGKRISVDAIDVMHSLASLLVPVSVAAFPNREQLVPSIDSAVDRGYDVLTRAVEVPYDRAVAALDRLSERFA